MLVNRAVCAVRHAVKKGNGDSPMEFVKLTENLAVATNNHIAVIVTIPVYDSSHPLGDGFKGPRLVLGKHLGLVEKILPRDDDDRSPTSSAVVTEESVKVLDGKTVELNVSSNNGDAPSLPFPDIEYPNVAGLVPPASRQGSNTVELDIKALQSLLRSAKAAGLEKVAVNVPANPEDLVRVDGVGGLTQLFTAVIKPIVPDQEEPELF